MKMRSSELTKILKPVVGQLPWRVRLGWGSFVTFDFGPKVKKDNHTFGSWHLWIYQCEWQLVLRDQSLAHSESKRPIMDVAVRRLERQPFEGCSVSEDQTKTTFEFGGDFQLICTRYSDFKPGVDDGEYWMFFLPDKRVVSVGPAGIDLTSSQKPHPVRA